MQRRFNKDHVVFVDFNTFLKVIQPRVACLRNNRRQNTKQIMLKKLMKDIEMAIRASDIQDKGQVDIREFKQCLYNLNYLQAL